MTSALAAFAYLVHWYRTGQGLSPDGEYYLRTVAREPVPKPYSFRWALPRLLGDRLWSWRAASAAGVIGAAALMEPRAAWLFLWLPMTSLNVRLPVLVDAPAFALALGSAVAASRGWWSLSAALGLAAGACKESAPVFAAAWSLSPWPLLGLLAAAWWRWPAPPDQPWLERPWSSARRDPLDWRRLLLPWGAVLPLAWAGMGWDRATFAAGVALVLGYSQLLRSMDDARLYQWAFPAVAVLACRAEGWWVLPALAAHPFVCATHRGT